jgi:hypothetical protein
MINIIVASNTQTDLTEKSTEITRTSTVHITFKPKGAFGTESGYPWHFPRSSR